MESNTIHLRLINEPLISINRNPNYIYDKSLSTYTNIKHLTNICLNAITKFNINKDDVLVVHISKEINSFLILALTNVMQYKGIRMMFEIDDTKGKEFNIPLVSTYSGCVENPRYNKRLSVFIENSKLNKEKSC